MSSYLFFLGRSSDLAAAEVIRFFPDARRIGDTVMEVASETVQLDGNPVATPDLIQRLGGTVKIGTVLSRIPELSINVLEQAILSDPKSHITFGISTYEGVQSIPGSWYPELKTRLEAQGKKVRFLLPSEGKVLSSVAIEKQGVTEYALVSDADGILVSRTDAVQEFESWAHRDMGRPYSDSKKGMLPLKASRMVVNLALGPDAKGKTLLDPFCGMGTIPSEALLCGVIAMGSDADGEAVQQAKANSVWLRREHPELPPVTYFTADATHVSGQIGKESVDAIVTEPFMGSPKLGEGRITDPKEIKNAVKGLEKLYRGCLKDWISILKPGGCVVMAIPEIIVGKTVFSVKSVIDSCETLGYTKQQGPYRYSRPQAVVHRMFYLLTKQN